MVDTMAGVIYGLQVVEILRSGAFRAWLKGLRDREARSRIIIRIERLQAGNAGDVKPVGDGISEMRIPHGPGYRVYFFQQGPFVVVLLAGGSKGSQAADIAAAKLIAKAWKPEEI